VSRFTLFVEEIELALRAALDKLESQLEAADAAYADAQWRRHFDRASGHELERLEAARAALLLDERARETLRRWETRAHDQALARRVALLARRFRWAAIESRPQVYELRNRLDRLITVFRPQVNGKPFATDHSHLGSRADCLETLRRHPDRARRCEAWLALGLVCAQVEAGVRELMRRRERLARELGYDGFVAWALETIGLSRPWVEAFFDELERLTDAPYRAWLAASARRLSLRDGLRPWDLAFAAEQAASLPEALFPAAGLRQAVQTLAEGLGLGQEAAGVRVDAVDIPYAGLCYAVRPPQDVRVLFNPRHGHACYSTLFHEFGHALAWRCLRPSSPVLCQEAPPFGEAMACTWERLAWDPDWLAGRDGLTPGQARTYGRAWAGRTMYRLRLFMAQATFEYRAYGALHGDLSALWRDTYARYLAVPCDPSPGWANSPFWTSHPVYVQNYVIAEAVASQTLAALRRRFGRLIGEPRVGAWLVEHYYGPGAALPWADKVLQATGAPLSSADLVADLKRRRE
jgi:peptidyl-dipeptidase A